MKHTVKAILARVGGDRVAAFNYCMGIAFEYRHHAMLNLEYNVLAAIFAGKGDLS